MTKEERQLISYRQLRSPRKVIPTYAGWYGCPHCKSTVDREYTKYCPYCGQALDWNDWYLNYRYQSNYLANLSNKIDSLLGYYETNHKLNSKHRETLRYIAYNDLLQYISSRTTLRYYTKQVNTKTRIYYTVEDKTIYWFNL